MQRVKLGVIGIGHLGAQHVRVLSSIHTVELVGVFDIDIKKAQEVASVYNTKFFPDLESLLRETDAVSCVVPTNDHYTVAKEALLSSRHIFVEKPLARNIEEAEELVELSEKKGVKLQVGHIERFNPAILAVKGMVKTPRFIETHRLAPYNPRGTDVDVVIDLMIHDIDVVLYLLQEEPIKVEAIGIPVLTDKVDIANVRMEFPSGAVANLNASRVYRDKLRKIRIFQKDTYFSIDYLTRDLEMYRKIEDVILPYFPPIEKNREPLRVELESFVGAILTDSEPRVSGTEGLKALRVAFRILEKIGEHLRRTSIE